MSSPVSYDLQGQGGGILISDSTTITGNFRWIQGITDFEIDAIVSSNISNASGIIGYTIPAGSGIGGRFTSITLNNGIAIAYYA
jgi:hypothetical protein